jgi:hypothetical protein
MAEGKFMCKEIPSIVKEFAEKCDREKFGINTLRTFHPKLPIKIYFPDNKPGYGNLRITIGRTSNLRRTEEVILRFSHLIKTLDYMYLNLHPHFKLDENPDLDARIMQNFRWIHEAILGSDSFIPILGPVQVDAHQRAPWEKKGLRDGELFSPFQLELVDYFSMEGRENSKLMETAAAALLDWHKLFCPDGLKTLVGIKKDGNPYDS